MPEDLPPSNTDTTINRTHASFVVKDKPLSNAVRMLIIRPTALMKGSLHVGYPAVLTWQLWLSLRPSCACKGVTLHQQLLPALMFCCAELSGTQYFGGTQETVGNIVHLEGSQWLHCKDS